MIETVQLTNVLAFRELDLPLRNLTLLTGANSAGKSSILHALAALRQSNDAQMLPEALLLNGNFVELGAGADVLHADPIALDGADEVLLRVGIEVAGKAESWTAAYEQTADVLLLKDAPSAAPQVGLFNAGFQYLKADRLVPEVTYPKSHEAVTVQRSLGPRGEHAPNYLRVHGKDPIACERARDAEAATSQLLDQANAWINRISPGSWLDVADIEGTELVRLRFSRMGPEVKTNPQRATNVGFGLTYALPIIISCLIGSPNDLILIENPEAHLHPRGQALLGRLCALCAAGGAQVVVESHSDHVLNAIRLAVKQDELDSEQTIMHFFDRESGVLQPHLATVEVNEEGMIAEWPKGFFDQWDSAVEELLD